MDEEYGDETGEEVECDAEEYVAEYEETEEEELQRLYGIEPEEPYSPPRSPSHLSKRAKKLWRAVVAERVKGIPAQALLLSALEAREILAAEGITIATGTDRNMTRIHPAVRIEKDARSQFSRIWGQLNLTWGK